MEGFGTKEIMSVGIDRQSTATAGTVQCKAKIFHFLIFPGKLFSVEEERIVFGSTHMHTHACAHTCMHTHKWISAKHPIVSLQINVNA